MIQLLEQDSPSTPREVKGLLLQTRTHMPTRLRQARALRLRRLIRMARAALTAPRSDHPCPRCHEAWECGVVKSQLADYQYLREQIRSKVLRLTYTVLNTSVRFPLRIHLAIPVIQVFLPVQLAQPILSQAKSPRPLQKPNGDVGRGTLAHTPIGSDLPRVV